MNDNLVFFDTNILVYSYSVTDKDKYEKAIEVMGDSYCYISTQVISEFCNVLTRKMRFNPLKIKELTRGFELYFHIFTVNKNTTESALDILNRYGYSYYDSLILASALENDCKIIYSEDMQHGQVII
ncbi:MAG: PIN domain-containing protein [Fibromonadaceae bacterium]|jgi:predicted nucleic acid-binding protein|nr:PIN domain-containing protein [Fibromonadaceae bacterium]